LTIGHDVLLDDNVTIGYPHGQALRAAAADSESRERSRNLDTLLDRASRLPTRLGNDAVIRSGTTLYEGVVTGDRLETGHGVVIRERCCLGTDVYVDSGGQIRTECVVGDHVKVAGKVGDRSRIGAHSTILGMLLHTFLEGVSMPDECGPEIEEGVVVAYGAVVIGPVRVGRLSYVAANAVVTKDVPPGVVVAGSPAKVMRPRSRAECPALWERVVGP
jgi:serine acetyltransferase